MKIGTETMPSIPDQAQARILVMTDSTISATDSTSTPSATTNHRSIGMSSDSESNT